MRSSLILSLLLAAAANAQTYTISTFAGGAPPVTPVPGVQASIGTPQGVAADPAGNIYFTGLNCLFELSVAGTLTRLAGTSRAGYSGDNGPATSAQFNNPTGVAIDAGGNLYIADTANNRIRKVSTTGVITTVAGNGTLGYAGDGGPAISAQLSRPAAVALDTAGNLYISDGGNSVIREVTGGTIATIAGNGTSGSAGDGGPAAFAQLNNPRGMAFDNAGNLYIADLSNNVVRKVSTTGIITTIAVPLPDPDAVALDSAGNLYIAFQGFLFLDSVVIKVSTAGIITNVAGTTTSGFSGDGGPAANAHLNAPAALALDGAGNLYIADSSNHRIRKVSTTGIITTVAGNGANSFSGDGAAPAAAQLGLPQGVALDAAGNLYIADTANNRIRKVSAGVITTIAGTGIEGFSGDNGAALSAQLANPIGLALDASGNVYIADTANNRIREVSVAGVITTVAGNGTPGFSGDGGAALSAQLSSPTSVAIDAAGNLYIADSSNARVRKVSTSGIITTIAGGSFGDSGDGDPSYDAQLVSPTSLAVDAAGNLYIADSGGDRIRKIAPDGIISTVPTTMVSQFEALGGFLLSATLMPLNEVIAVAADSAGNLYIAEAAGYRIRKVSTSGIVTIIAGGNGTGDSGDGGPAREAQLNLPAGLAVDATGNVYIADSANNAIRLLTPLTPPCTYALSAISVAAPSAGENATVNLTTTAGCPWAISDLPDWITAANAATTGPATITVTIAANTGAPRSATIAVAGIADSVSQASSVLLVNPGGVVDAAGFRFPIDNLVGISPGSLVSIYGNFLLPTPLSATSFPIPTSLGGLSLQVGGVPVPLFYASGAQVNAQVPWELQRQLQATLTATFNGQTSAPQIVHVASYSPGIFAINGAGSGQGAILDPSYRLADATNPATAGTTVVQIFCTGLGPVSNQPATGAPSPTTPPAQTTVQPTVTIGDVDATVQFSGLAPGAVGLYQVNALVPPNSATGNAVSVVITIAGVQSNTVTMAVQ